MSEVHAKTPMQRDLTIRLEKARAEVVRLERAAAGATCAELGKHDWQSDGGCSAGCDPWCICSVPVNRCARCGDYDYGKNTDAIEIRRSCTATRY